MLLLGLRCCRLPLSELLSCTVLLLRLLLLPAIVFYLLPCLLLQLLALALQQQLSLLLILRRPCLCWRSDCGAAG